MDFIDQLKQFSSRIEKMQNSIQTEEATKTSMIMPFFKMLGYDVFNPLEFVPEYTADFGIKKGEKVDYAIMDDNQKPLILIEAKCHGEDLGNHGSQLFRYFTTTPAKFGILTNGVVYRFYTDLEEQNKMDDKPFLEVDLLNIKDNLVAELKKFQKSTFDLDTILTTASELKYNSQIKQFFTRQLEAPTDEFVAYILNNVYEGRKTQKVIEDFRGIVKKSLIQFVNEQVNDRLKLAIGTDEPASVEETPQTSQNDDVVVDAENPKIITTQEEIEAFFTVKAILHDVLNGHKLTYKDTESYFGILLDGNSWKWVCRLKITDKKAVLILPGENKKEIKYPLDFIDDLHQYKDKMVSVINRYVKG